MSDLTHLIEIIGIDNDTVEIRSVALSTRAPRSKRLRTVELIYALSPRPSLERLGFLLGDSKESGPDKDDPGVEDPNADTVEPNTPLSVRVDIGVHYGLPSQLHRLIAEIAAPNVSVHEMPSPFPDAALLARERLLIHEIDLASEEESGSKEGSNDKPTSNDDDGYEVGSDQS
jgi:hypothetical protein